MEYTYIIDLASIIVILGSIYNMAEAGKDSLRKRVERVAGHFRGRIKAEEVF